MPGVQRVPSRALDLFIVRGFLDSGICAELIERIDSRRRPSDIVDDVGIANFRTSETCDLDLRDPVVAEVDNKIGALLGLDLASSEPLQGQRYAPGQEFRAHTDTFEPGGYDYYVHTADAGQRTWTAMVYLNQPEDGGRPGSSRSARPSSPSSASCSRGTICCPTEGPTRRPCIRG
jgi:prolyl 4-hydroxylase